MKRGKSNFLHSQDSHHKYNKLMWFPCVNNIHGHDL
uniref:Uncharacterized protein n=1 Tax=Rhizophora mucronata TaxID=61149 RepID=A0A2P2PIV1_RHIMU